MTPLLPELNRETEADVSSAGLGERKSDNEGLTVETSASFFLGWKFDPYSLSLFQVFVLPFLPNSLIGLKFNDGALLCGPQ